jgi:hypothetical protein
VGVAGQRASTVLVAHGGDRYLVVDAWTSLDAFRRFKAAHGAAYHELDRACEALTLREIHVGDFEMVAGTA